MRKSGEESAKRFSNLKQVLLKDPNYFNEDLADLMHPVLWEKIFDGICLR
ncbi:MAG: hypothetical protein OXE78_13700 [Gammaproteobacteria bacterium]|nr:hypothetical protein [Gammaproteobacteria bacterium]MCY4356321.1 hypothetical protein [Gammaproteobacteria bacterium]